MGKVQTGDFLFKFFLIRKFLRDLSGSVVNIILTSLL
jgi:hypothetical protein